jgi:murein DD-endopeptidase MepM/ murein hydrolase activator NlpD
MKRISVLAAHLALVATLSGCFTSASADEANAVEDSAGTIAPSTFAASAIIENSLDARRALLIANSGTALGLELTVGLPELASQNIAAGRDGGDGIAGTPDDSPYYTLAQLSAVPAVDQTAIAQLALYAANHPERWGTGLKIAALPPPLATDPSAAGQITGFAADTSLMIDGDPTTLISSEWETTALFAHHFFPSTAAFVAKLRPYEFHTDIHRGPFIDLITIDRVNFGEGEPAWALDALLTRTAVDPHHTVGRIYSSELQSALADPVFVANNPGITFVQNQYQAIWNADVQVTDPGDLPLPLARTRALLASRGIATFDAPYPSDQPMPAIIAAMPLPMPFQSGTEIACMQGNNSMRWHASHGPDQLRYALDLDAPLTTTLVASAAGTAYVYGNGRPNSFDNFGFGNLLLIDLHNGYALLYAHLSSFAVTNGQNVTAGQVVGAVGVTGGAGTMPHVHFQVVPLFRTPDPVHEAYQSDTPIAGDAPFGTPQPYILRAIDLTIGTVAASIPSMEFRCGESGFLPGAAHIYRTP